VAVGTVISQSPSGGDELEEGDEVDLVVSSGPDTEPIPDVTGKPRGEAINDLRAAGFEVTEGERQASEDVKAGYVISQSPTGEAKPGSEVTIILSSGPEAENMPNVVEMQLEEARELLQSDPYNFDVPVDEVPSSQPAGTVVAQRPAANSPLEPGETVTLQVASGENVVPEIVGAGIEEAAEEVSSAGFEVERIAEPTEDQARIGVVTDVNPGAGERLELGSRVTITYGEAVGDSGEDVPPADA
jgi:serine/threonine-protein kinase